MVTGVYDCALTEQRTHTHKHDMSVRQFVHLPAHQTIVDYVITSNPSTTYKSFTKNYV